MSAPYLARPVTLSTRHAGLDGANDFEFMLLHFHIYLPCMTAAASSTARTILS